MLNRTSGIIGTVVGLILAILGAFTWFSLGHHKLGPALLVVGIIVLVFGIYAYMTSVKAKGSAA